MSADEEDFTPENTPVAGYSLPPPVPGAARKARRSGRPSTRRIWSAQKSAASPDPFAGLKAIRKVDGYEILGQLESQPSVLVQIARAPTDKEAPAQKGKARTRTVKIRRLARNELADRIVRREVYAEMECMAMLQHRHLERALEVRKIDQQLALITEWESGMSLCEMIEEAAPAAPCSWETVLAIFEQALAGLQYAHGASRPKLEQLRKELPWLREASGVFHGALTSADIHLSDRGVVRVRGVGLSHLREQNALTDEWPRTFLAPEVRAGDPPGPSADIYGAAACMLETLRPGALRSEDLASFVETLPGIPLELKALLHRALSLDPAQRFADLRAFATAVRAVPRQQEVTTARISELVAAYSSVEKKRAAIRRADSTEPGIQYTERMGPKQGGGAYAAPKALKTRKDPTLSFGTPSQGPPAPPSDALIDDHSEDLEELPENLVTSLSPKANSRRWWMFLVAVLAGVAALFLFWDPPANREVGGGPSNRAVSNESKPVPVVPTPAADHARESDAATLDDAASVPSRERAPHVKPGTEADTKIAEKRNATSTEPSPMPEEVTQRRKAGSVRQKSRKDGSRSEDSRQKTETRSSRPRMNNPGF